jgi:4-hydroxy-3-methylbut-2-en-1-yl diphosphate synthase IspG/GcpE
VIWLLNPYIGSLNYLKTHKMLLSKLKVNPGNPRLIKDDKFDQLIKSIQDFPDMMKLRPIVVDESFTILGGNMRYRAIQKIGMKEIPNEWVKVAKGLTEDQKKEFLVKDNVNFGKWEWDTIANEWDTDQLKDWGLDMPWMENNTGFNPNTNPATGGMNVSAEDMAAERKRLEEAMERMADMVSVSCPECGHSFDIDKPKT